MIEDLLTRIFVLSVALGLLGWGAYETFFNHKIQIRHGVNQDV